jgi:hypothetical protein
MMMDKETRKKSRCRLKEKKKKTITIVLGIVFGICQGRPYNRFYKPTENYARSPIY